MDASNKFYVGLGDGGSKVVVSAALPQSFSKDDALLLAAYLVALADPTDGHKRFAAWLEAVEGT